ncbi:N-acetylmuramoyl-L-alanine amidase [Bacillus sp. 1P06AnD]|uniref:N-acetylmuramoyl-L-alanine amidase n=1 Tax=Bacillus sp. 1P06AnD TaxID=3132208 RepID=UPI0039A36B1C
MVKIFIDPGHGGSDSGAIGNGIQEKNITLAVAIRVKNLLLSRYSNVEVKMSRTGDTFPSLSDRTNAANAWGAHFYLSIHINSGGGTGFEDYIFPGSGAPTSIYQNTIHAEIMKQVDFVDRGKKQSNLHVLRESRMPAILTENGFIDKAEDAVKLKNSAYLDKIALGHVNGLAKAFHLTEKPPVNNPNTGNGKGFYRLVTGTFPDEQTQLAAADAVRKKTGWIIYPYKSGGLRLTTGVFTSLASAQKAKAILEKEFGYIVYIKS